MGGKVFGKRAALKLRAIADKNLFLALLDASQERFTWLQELKAAYEDERGSHPTWPTWKAVRDGEDLQRNKELEEYLLKEKLSAEKLAQIEELEFLGDRDMYSWIFPYWWDEGDHFVIGSLSGIENCSGLKKLSLGHGLDKGCSLKPLAKLPLLRELRLNAEVEYLDKEALLRCTSLQKIEVVSLKASDDKAEWNHILDALVQKGLSSLIRR